MQPGIGGWRFWLTFMRGCCCSLRFVALSKCNVKILCVFFARFYTFICVNELQLKGCIWVWFLVNECEWHKQLLWSSSFLHHPTEIYNFLPKFSWTNSKTVLLSKYIYIHSPLQLKIENSKRQKDLQDPLCQLLLNQIKSAKSQKSVTTIK